MPTDSDWVSCTTSLPPEGQLVETKIDDGQGCRNTQQLRRKGRRWFVPDMAMRVYYMPTHWRAVKEVSDGWKKLNQVCFEEKGHRVWPTSEAMWDWWISRHDSAPSDDDCPLFDGVLE